MKNMYLSYEVLNPVIVVIDTGFLIQLLWERLEVAIGHHLAQIWSYGVLNPVIVGNGYGVLDLATISDG